MRSVGWFTKRDEILPSLTAASHHSLCAIDMAPLRIYFIVDENRTSN